MSGTTSPLSRLDALAVGAMLLAALAAIVPAAQQARTKSRLMQCRERLRHLSVGLFVYHIKHERLPPGIIAASDPALPNEPQFVARQPQCELPELTRASGFTLLLPMLEANATGDSYNHSLACCAAANATATARTVPTFLCAENRLEGPAQPWGYYRQPPGFASAAGPARTDFAFAVGGLAILSSLEPCPLNTGAQIPPQSRRPGQFYAALGAFHVNAAPDYSWHKDGMGQTAVMGEAVGGMPLGLDADAAPPDSFGTMRLADRHRTVSAAWSQGYVSDRRGLGGFGSVLAASAVNAWMSRQVQMAAPGDQAAPTDKGWKTLPPNEGGPRFARGSWMASSKPIWNESATGGGGAPVHDGALQGWRSGHGGKTPLLFGDGSVVLVGDNIDPLTLVALTSIRGGERVWPLPEPCQ